MFDTLKNKKGFTLIEIVIVIVIIAILAAILVPQIIRWIDKAKLATLKSEADTVRLSVIAYTDHEFSDSVSNSTLTQADVDADFWEGVSKTANTTLQASDPDENGYTTFTISNGAMKSFTYSKGGHTATYDGIHWSYE